MIWSLQAVPQLSDTEFALWSSLLEERAGIYLGNLQRTFLQTQVTMRMRELGIDNYGEYYNRIADGVSGRLEWAQLIDRLVVNETRFFRDETAVNFVAGRVADRLKQVPAQLEFDVWSVGCASGEEPYSLAMAINDMYRQAGASPRFSITATDISRAALSLARIGIYPERKLQTVSPGYRQRYFDEVGPGQFQVDSALMDRICFTQGNLLNIGEMPVFQVDVIFCQNLLVYFRRWLREKILNAFVERLKPGGILLIGLGEAVGWKNPALERVASDSVQAYIHK